MGQIPVKVCLRKEISVRVGLGMECICHEIKMVKDDTGPDLKFSIVDSNDQVVNLAGKIVKFFLKRYCLEQAVNLAHPLCIITNAAQGEAVYKFKPGDLSEIGTYFGDVQVSNVSGGTYVETSPEVVRLLVRDKNYQGG